MILTGLAGLFLSINPATSHRVSPFSILYDAVALLIGFGMVFLRKWAVIIFLALAVCAAVVVVRESFRIDIVRWAIYINLLLLVVPTWACLAAWRQLR